MPYVSPYNQDEGDLETGTRVCRDCDRRKPMAEFYRCGPERQYRARVCKLCRSHRERRGERRADAEAKALKREWSLRQKYGITLATHDGLFAEQDGRCAICRDPLAGLEARGDDRTNVDHDHATGRVRGLLCLRCNCGIGFLRDDPSIVRAAADYLNRPLPDVETPGPLSREEKRQRRSEGQFRRTQRSGKRSNVAILSSDQEAEIIRRYTAGGISQRALAEEYGVSQGFVSRLHLRWRESQADLDVAVAS